MYRSIFIGLLLVYNISFAQVLLPAKITVEKSTYLLGEPVNVKLAIKNVTGELIPISTYQFAGNFSIEDKNDKTLKLLVRSSAESTWYLFPGDSLIRVYNLASLFGLFVPGDPKTYFGLPEGTYTIKFQKIQNDLSIESNKLSVTLVPPQGKEKEAFRLYNQAWHSDLNNQEQRKTKFMEVIDKYPQSSYALASLIWVQPGEEERIIRDFPNSYQSWRTINKVLVDHKLNKDKAGAETFLREIITQHPGSFAAQEAHRRLEEIQSLSLEEWLKPELAVERKLREYQEKQQQER